MPAGPTPPRHQYFTASSRKSSRLGRKLSKNLGMISGDKRRRADSECRERRGGLYLNSDVGGVAATTHNASEISEGRVRRPRKKCISRDCAYYRDAVFKRWQGGSHFFLYENRSAWLSGRVAQMTTPFCSFSHRSGDSNRYFKLVNRTVFEKRSTSVIKNRSTNQL